jgi:hypothetical protein
MNQSNIALTGINSAAVDIFHHQQSQILARQNKRKFREALQVDITNTQSPTNIS